MHTSPTVLILGGTAEARRLAERIGAGGRTSVVTSLAGRTADPRRPAAGAVRVGGFGGAGGLARWLREHRVDALIDATHPFAERISANAAAAAADVHVPLLALRRPAWAPVPGDRWHRAGSLAEAAALLPGLGGRVFLTTGRLGLAHFAGPELAGLWFLVRSVDPPQPPLPARAELLLARGPFTVDAERHLLRERGIDVVVTKDSGGAATAAKLTAARELGLPVVVVGRPPVPPGVPEAADVDGAVAWSARVLGRCPGGRDAGTAAG